VRVWKEILLKINIQYRIATVCTFMNEQHFDKRFIDKPLGRTVYRLSGFSIVMKIKAR
jgi:hypothetical protein